MEPQGDYFGEVRTAAQIGKSLTAKRLFAWAKCPQCGEGKWSRKDHLYEDGVTAKTRCRFCKPGINWKEKRTGGAVYNRFFRYCSACGLHKRLTDYYPKRGTGYTQGHCKECTKASRKKDYEENREEILAKHKEGRWGDRLKLIDAYGGKCECCGETLPEFLTVDHIGGGGGEHRRQVGGTNAVIREIASQGYPRDRYRLLCYNCNCSIGARGYCPHSRLNSTSNEIKS